MIYRVFVLFMFILLNVYGKELGYPHPMKVTDPFRLDIRDETQVTQMVRILKAYPLILEVNDSQKKVIDRLEDNEKLYDSLRKDLERQHRKDQVIIIALGVSIPIIAGLVGWGVWELRR